VGRAVSVPCGNVRSVVLVVAYLQALSNNGPAIAQGIKPAPVHVYLYYSNSQFH